MKKYKEYILDEECELIDQKLLDEGLFDFFKKKKQENNDVSGVKQSDTSNHSNSEIANTYRNLKTEIGTIGDLLTKGEYSSAATKLNSLTSSFKSLESNLNTLVKKQNEVKKQYGDSIKNKEEYNQKPKEDEDDTTAPCSVQTESCFNY